MGCGGSQSQGKQTSLQQDGNERARIQKQYQPMNLDDKISELLSDKFNNVIRQKQTLLKPIKKDQRVQLVILKQRIQLMDLVKNSEILQTISTITAQLQEKDKLIIGMNQSNKSKELIALVQGIMDEPFQRLNRDVIRPTDNQPSQQFMPQFLLATLEIYHLIIANLDFNLIDKEKWWAPQKETQYIEGLLRPIIQEVNVYSDAQMQQKIQANYATFGATNNTGNPEGEVQEYLNQLYKGINTNQINNTANQEIDFKALEEEIICSKVASDYLNGMYNQCALNENDNYIVEDEDYHMAVKAPTYEINAQKLKNIGTIQK